MQNKVEALADIFGSQADLARACRIDPMMVVRWKRKGAIPTKYNDRIKRYAAVYFPDADVVPHLENPVCEHCGKVFEK